MHLIQLQREKEALEKTAPKPPAPAKLNPPTIKMTKVGREGELVRVVFEVTNPNADPLPYAGYTADSFDPKIPNGTIAPLYRVEFLRGKEWKAHQVGWCKTGQGAVTIPGKGKVTFDAHVPAGDWEEARIGLVWFATAERKDPQTVWGEPIGKKEFEK